jgi:hypothetical protein
MRIWSWNIRKTVDAWSVIAKDSSVDAVLLQEAIAPPTDARLKVAPPVGEPWVTTGTGNYRTAIAWRGDRITATERPLISIGDDSPNSLCVSRRGTLSAIDVRLDDGVLTLVSAYAVWERPCSKERPIYADASAHRLISDISGIVTSRDGHRLIVAGDFNILHGHGEHGSEYWRERYASVFSRFDALGLKFIGPQFSSGGRQANPWPAELPRDSKNVPTSHSSKQSPSTAT